MPSGMSTFPSHTAKDHAMKLTRLVALQAAILAMALPMAPPPMMAIGAPWGLAVMGSDVEAHALREGKGVAVVDGVGCAAHVALPGVGARFAAAAGFLLAAKGATDFGT